MNTDLKAQQETIKRYDSAMQADRAALKAAYKAAMEKNPEKVMELIRTRLAEIGMLQEGK